MPAKRRCRNVVHSTLSIFHQIFLEFNCINYIFHHFFGLPSSFLFGKLFCSTCTDTQVQNTFISFSKPHPTTKKPAVSSLYIKPFLSFLHPSNVFAFFVLFFSSSTMGSFQSLFIKLCFLFLIFILIITSVSCHGGHHDDDGDEGDEQVVFNSEEKPNLRSKSLILVKIWCLILVFIGTFIGGISPYFMKWNEGFLVLGTQFAGGVFLGTALMHFLSDSNETFGDLTTKEYPFAFMLASAGYLLTLLADCVISHVYSKEGSNGDAEAGNQQQQEKASSNGRSSRLNVNDAEGMEHHEKPSVTAVRSLGDSILLIVALCSHSVFEGIAIGVAETKADAWRALWTVSLHKVFAAIAMGIALLRIIPDRPLLSCAAYAFAFAISSPIGVAIGIVIDSTTQGHVADWIYAISMGLACGVFIYVAINHLLAKGYLPQKSTLLEKPLYKFLAVTLGIGVIAVVMIWD